MNLRSIDAEAILQLQQELLGQHECDPDLLAAALAYPLERAISYVDVAGIAAAYAVGMLTHHPFSIGNAQAALIAMGTFLYLNEWQLNASPTEATHAMQQLLSGRIDEEGLADWIRQNL